MGDYRYREKVKRGMAFTLALVIGGMAFLPGFPVLPAKAQPASGQQTTLTSAHGNTPLGHKLYCIDKGGYAIWGIAEKGDRYEARRSSQASVPLSSKEQKYVFWAMLSLKAALGDTKANTLIQTINTAVKTQGRPQIDKMVSEEDLKTVIYLPATRAKYPWLEEAASNCDFYMRMGGLLSSGSSSTGKTGIGGGKIPEVISSCTSLGSAKQVDTSTLILSFAQDGSDSDFIRSVPLEFSNDGGVSFSPQPTDGWTYTKTDTQIVFKNPNPKPEKALIRFRVEGTSYAAGGGGYSSSEEAIDHLLQIWECVECSGTHGGGTPAKSDPWIHQRMAWMEIDMVPVNYYAVLAGDPIQTPQEGGIQFEIFRHEEDFTSTYNLQMYKYDHETGKALEGARFGFFERFDDKDKVNTKRDGAVELYEGGEPYASHYEDDPVIWNGFRQVGSVVTDANGYGLQMVEHAYHYDKTFCDGHPAPTFVSVPEEEEDEEGDITNSEAIEAAKAENIRLADSWILCEQECEEQALGEFDGVHFHWIMDEVDVDKIESIASDGGSEGETPDAGATTGADGENSYAQSGCQEDCEQTYEKFISMKYSYTWKEFKARDGYILHDGHADDLPIEIITTDASENGANSFFGGAYSKDVVLGADSVRQSREEERLLKEDSENSDEKNASRSVINRDALFDDAKFPNPLKMNVLPQRVVLFTALDAALLGEATPSELKELNTLKATASEPKLSISDHTVNRVKKGFVFIDEDKEVSKNAFKKTSENVSKELAKETRGTVTANFYRNDEDSDSESTISEALFLSAYEEALISDSVGPTINPGNSGNFSHCNGRDGEKNAWRIYDHRTEGEIHINKKDLDLKKGENELYSALGDAQGDATLEGAVYGLFAAEDLIHPDGKTGAVYLANQLVAVATTDKNGDASFLACTEAPGRTYDYSKGTIVDTKDGWRNNAPGNLYTKDASIDDYTDDHDWERIYYNNASNNGNTWIGRPLFMGEYYVKELSRSEGFELSVGNKLHAVTNLGQDLDVGVSKQGEGYAHISMQMYGEEQAGDGGADTNEIFFSSESKDTKNGMYDIVVSGLPDDVIFYRKDEGKGTVSVETGTGVYEKVYTGEFAVAEHDYQYPRYNADGTLMKKKMPIDYMAGWMRQVKEQELVPETVETILLQAETGMTYEENTDKLTKSFKTDDFYYLKGKVEKVLRRHGKSTPGTSGKDGNAYSDIYNGVFDRGVREGDRDIYGVSGVTPGEKANKTVYGSPIQTIAVPKTKDGNSITVGDAIMSVLDFYNKNPYFSYGGLDAVRETFDVFEFTIYAGISGIPENFMVLGSDSENDSVIHHRAEWMPDDEKKCPRYVYVPYSNNSEKNAFGTYTDYRETTAGNQVMASALLKTDAFIAGDGTIIPKENEVNVYYKTGETPYDESGQPIRAFYYREVTETQQREVTETKWVSQAAVRNTDGTYVLRINANFTDSFGVKRTNAGVFEELGFKAVLKDKKITLNEDDAAKLGNGFVSGHKMNSSSYYTKVKNARAKAYLDYSNSGLMGDDSYVVPVTLVYPGQEMTYQDAKTRENPSGVLERVIRQKIKIIKDIETTPDGTYAHNTYAESGHSDQFTKKEGGKENVASSLKNFRFKLYLKSNLERLYRNSDGEIVWIDRDGNAISPEEEKKKFPVIGEDFVQVQKIFTQVSHEKNSKTAGSINNNVWESAVNTNKSLYGYSDDGTIADTETKNSGYTRLLETITQTKEDGAGNVRKCDSYQYEKFFDAIAVANRDKWQQSDDKSTSFKPFSWIRKGIFGTGGDEKKDPVLHDNSEIKNEIRTSDAAAENAKRSDAVRQFAIDWYLNDEVKKKTETLEDSIQAAGGSEEYQDEVYDESLYQAILKSEEYLKPFFSYDLDKIYAIEWDSAENGGSDKDMTTLSADLLSDDGYYAVSTYIPYGTYVAVEQQPYSGELEDFKNRHYRIDQPKEIEVPSVYETDGNQLSPEKKSSFYQYDASSSPETVASKYNIRMNEEWGNTNQIDLREYVIRAHSQDGNYEIYKYGLDADKLNGRISYSGGTYDYSGFSIAQREKTPYKDIYQAENENSRYVCNEKVEKYYKYGAISEQSGFSDNVEYSYGNDTDDNNPRGFYFKDNVKTITGAITGFDGRYFQALVPYSVTEPANVSEYDKEKFIGYADGKYRNTFYTAKIRIEKLDSETGENILHDDAVFAIYAASRDTSVHSEGEVSFYDKDTQVTASREFLEAMGAKDIEPLDKQASVPSKYPWKAPYTGKYTGVIPAGTPICSEDEQVVMRDEFGNRTGTFKVYSTLNDFGGDGEKIPSNQNTGYLVTPQPLGAGVYVLCELSAPEGYVKTKPVAVEVYSDEITYYIDGLSSKRVSAAVYKEKVARTDDNGELIKNNDGTKPNGNKPMDRGDVARVYVENTPIRLEISKVKQDENEILFELNERYEGSITELSARYGLENLELAYNASGAFLGYGWPKGYLDRLKERKNAGELIDLIYEDQVFTGRSVLHRTPDTALAVNRYLPGASMRLYDAIEVKKNGDSEDRAYAGVNVVRDSFGNVTRMYVQKGYAGNKLLYVKDKDEISEKTDYKKYNQDDALDDHGKGNWTLKRIEREDTDILYFDLGDLDVFTTLRGVNYAYNEKGETVRPKDGEAVYAMKNGIPFLKIICPRYEELKYSSKERRFEKVPSGTKIYHLAVDKSLDAEVEPYTGMAYVIEEKTGKILVWPVLISRDRFGNIIGRDKIKTGRTATINADTENEYTIGTYDGNILKHQVNPLLNDNGLPIFYQISRKTYIKGYPIYDRDGDYVRYRYSDLLKAYNANAWELKLKSALYDIGHNEEKREDDLPLYYRQGEAYLMENSWTTGDLTPNDPFNTRIGEGQVDVLKRVAAGTYILEETKAPSGYVKRFPVGLTVEESSEVQATRITNRPITVQIEKIDAPESYNQSVLDYDGILKETDKKSLDLGKGSYSFSSVEGAVLALYQAKRVASDDLKKHPLGYYLEKKSDTPASWTVLDDVNRKKTVIGKWTVGKAPMVWEGIPAGDYILEEVDTLPGYLPGRLDIVIGETSELQLFTMCEDHIKTAFFKYENKDGKKECLPNNYAAELTLYEAVTDKNGIVMDADGLPVYNREKKVTSWKTEDARAYTEGYDSFSERYKKLYEEYKTGFDSLIWCGYSAGKLEETSTAQGESVSQLWDLGNGFEAKVQVTKNLKEDGKSGYVYDFMWNYRVEDGVTSFDTSDGFHRIDYLPATTADINLGKGNKKGYYVLVETKTPDGYQKAEPKPVIVDETAEIQLYGLENKAKSVWISKSGRANETAIDFYYLDGAEMAVFKAAADGSFIKKDEYLVDHWISGGEGRFTQEDAENKVIPDGFKVGDLRPHKISPIPYGTYYLTELKAPEGYRLMEPKKFIVAAASSEKIEAVNELKQGKIKIEKTDERKLGEKLNGAVFEIKNRDTGECFLVETDENGQAESELLSIGTVGTDGKWIPYHYEVKEIVPPDGYQIKSEIYEVVFEEQEECDVLTYGLTITDEPTKIKISKLDFDSAMFVTGAKMAVYDAELKDGIYTESGYALETWLSDGKTHVIEGKLIAGHTYILKELEAPSGYNIQSPVIFTISNTGRSISTVNDGVNMLKTQTAGDLFDNITSVRVHGRKAMRIVRTLHDLESGKEYDVSRLTDSSGYLEQEKCKEEGIVEKNRLELIQKILYSDGSLKTIQKDTFRLNFDENSRYPLRLRVLKGTKYRIEEEDGSEIESWRSENTDGMGYIHEISNPEYRDLSVIKVDSDNEKNENALYPESLVLPDGALAIVGNVTGTAEKSLRQTEVTYTVYFRDKDGKELPGLVSYSGSKSGKIKSSEKISLFCGEYIVMTGLAWGTNYEIKANIPETSKDGNKIEWKSLNTSGYTSKDGSTAIWEFRQNDPSIREIFKRGQSYHLIEIVEFDDEQHEEVETNHMIFSLGDDAQINGIGMIDAKTHLIFSKTDLGGKELPGAIIEISTLDGEVVETWISTDIPHEIIGKLTPGETYVMRETASPNGYAYAEKITFTVSKDGTIEQVLMQDAPTHVEITKYSLSGECELPGARLELWEDREGSILVDTWTSDRSAHVIKGKLKAGNTYVLVEKTAPDGYHKAESVTFTVSSDGSIDRVKMYDKPTQVQIEKREWSEQEAEGKFIKGAHLKITDENGNLITEWMSEENEKLIQGVLKEGGRYTLEEVKAPVGYEKAAPVTFTVSESEAVTVVKMYDRIKTKKTNKPGRDKPENPKKIIEETKEGYLTVHVRENISGEGKIELGERQIKPLPKMGYGEEASWKSDDINQLESEQEDLREVVLFLWKWKLLIGFLFIAAGIVLIFYKKEKSDRR